MYYQHFLYFYLLIQAENFDKYNCDKVHVLYRDCLWGGFEFALFKIQERDTRSISHEEGGQQGATCVTLAYGQYVTKHNARVQWSNFK